MKRSQPLARSTRLQRGKKRLKARRVPKGFRHRRDYAYQEWVRGQPCFVRLGCSYFGHGIDVAHIKTRATGGDDRANIVPLCRYHHEEQHRIGIPAFERHWAVNLKAEAEALYARYQQETDL